jgi:hypothetical protein
LSASLTTPTRTRLFGALLRASRIVSTLCGHRFLIDGKHAAGRSEENTNDEQPGRRTEPAIEPNSSASEDQNNERELNPNSRELATRNSTAARLDHDYALPSNGRRLKLVACEIFLNLPCEFFLKPVRDGHITKKQCRFYAKPNQYRRNRLVS